MSSAAAEVQVPHEAVPYDRAAPPVRRRYARPALGLLAAVAVVFGALALIGRCARDDTPLRVGTPVAAGGLVRLDGAVDLADVRARLHGDGVTAAYGQPGASAADVIVVAAADTRPGGTAAKLDRFYAELRAHARPVDPADIRPMDAGPLGGVLRCHPVTYLAGGLTLPMCVWADRHSVGSVLALPGRTAFGTLDQLGALTREMRPDIEQAR
ncbi:hypothetical protein [Yinghuangia seranimata]|uniref:hypothetical protein n=1 Tax=Yinghuangia seranimata TaxID=408067 RepID=UPI00248C8550|nr:hypothetical protein [Yinghuangia seranimata]MDI2127370.1 hypothetical protein [Yinghuangia seranimata]